MKHILYVLLFLSIGGAVLLSQQHERDERVAVNETELAKSKVGISSPPLGLYIAQDVSGSNEDYGVVILSRAELQPYKSVTGRDLYLFFNIIDSNSAQRMVNAFLPKKTFSKPVYYVPPGTNGHAEELLAKKHRQAVRKYEQDSVVYMANRNRVFNSFYNQVEQFIKPYQRTIVNKNGDSVRASAQYTDLVTAVKIADKAFTDIEGAELYLILNSDGFDTNGRVVDTITHNVEVLLVNAHDKETPALKKIRHVKFQSMSQAVTYSLKKKNTNYGY